MLFIILAMSAVVAAADTLPFNNNNNCDNILAEDKIDKKQFTTVVGHLTHSLYLEPLRHFIEPEASEDNSISVVNLRLSQPQRILYKSPLAGYDASISNFELRTKEFIERNNAPDFISGNDDIDAKLKHAYHMQSMWKNIGIYYRQLKSSPPANAKELCACIINSMNDDILAVQNRVGGYLESGVSAQGYGKITSADEEMVGKYLYCKLNLE